jgi:hypothetical protein
LKLNNLPLAGKHLHTALESAWQLHALPIVLGTGIFFGRLMYAEGQLDRDALIHELMTAA